MIYMIWGSDARGGWDTDRCEWYHGASTDKDAVERRVNELNDAVKAGDRATVIRLDPTGYPQLETFRSFEDLRYQLVEVPPLI